MSELRERAKAASTAVFVGNVRELLRDLCEENERLEQALREVEEWLQEDKCPVTDAEVRYKAYLVVRAALGEKP